MQITGEVSKPPQPVASLPRPQFPLARRSAPHCAPRPALPPSPSHLPHLRRALRLRAALRDGPSSNEVTTRPDPDVDPDLLHVLSLATDEELEQIYDGLYATSLLSPLAKSLQSPSAPAAALAASGRDALVRRIDRRFRFLAADSNATLRGQVAWPSYRTALLMIHKRLGVPCATDLATHDLEAEIFLTLLKEHADAVDAAGPAAASAAEHAAHGDGAAQGGGGAGRNPNVVQRLLAPLKLGAKEVVPTLTRLGATLAVTNAQLSIARQLGTALVRRSVQYEAAAQVATAAAGSAANRAALGAARRGLAAAASRYGAARSLLSVLGPAMWALTAVDLARMSVGCDYARIVRTVFALAQIRLLRTDGWVTKSQLGDDNDDMI